MKISISKTGIGTGQIQGPAYEKEVRNCARKLNDRTGAGNDFLGWLDLPAAPDASLLSDLARDAARIRSGSDLLVVIGIGGSYLGARAVIEALSDPFSSLRNQHRGTQVVFAGQNLSEDYHARLMALLDEKDYSVAVISKSGTTTEPAVAFRLIRRHIENKYGSEEARKRIYAITDQSRGALRKLADMEGYTTYVIPDDVGGRFSVLTPVGLLPIAAAGYDFRELLAGAAEMREQVMHNGEVMENPALLYAAARNLLYRSGKTTEIMVTYEPGLVFLTEWWKQLYGESEGKQGRGIFPAGVNFTTDLHSMGQYIQEGLRNIFETVISVENPANKCTVPEEPDDSDGLNFIAGKRLSQVNRQAELGTMLAHTEGGVPNIMITLPEINERSLGGLIFFFEYACAVSGYILGVNPFDQPGVEAYKKNMFALLGKPGFETETQALRKRLE